MTNDSNIDIIEYLDGFQYKNQRLQFFPHAEGYVNVLNKEDEEGAFQHNFDYVYNYTDHLGNIRFSYTQNPSTGGISKVEENHYYPGLEHGKYNSGRRDYRSVSNSTRDLSPVSNNQSYKYKYNCKELQDELGLDWYDYGARNYDPTLGRWMNIDPLAEKYSNVSPYNYTLNNPIVFVDPNGMDIKSMGLGSETYSSISFNRNGISLHGRQE